MAMERFSSRGSPLGMSQAHTPAEPGDSNKVQHLLSQPIVTSGCTQCDRMVSSTGGLLVTTMYCAISYRHNALRTRCPFGVKPPGVNFQILTSLPPDTDEDITEVDVFWYFWQFVQW